MSSLVSLVSLPRTQLRKGRVFFLITVLVVLGLYTSQFISVRERKEYLGEWTEFEKTPDGVGTYTFWNGTTSIVLSDPTIMSRDLRGRPNGLVRVVYYDLVYHYNIYGKNFLTEVKLNSG